MVPKGILVEGEIYPEPFPILHEQCTLSAAGVYYLLAQGSKSWFYNRRSKRSCLCEDFQILLAAPGKILLDTKFNFELVSCLEPGVSVFNLPEEAGSCTS